MPGNKVGHSSYLPKEEPEPEWDQPQQHKARWDLGKPTKSEEGGNGAGTCCCLSSLQALTSISCHGACVCPIIQQTFNFVFKQYYQTSIRWMHSAILSS